MSTLLNVRVDEKLKKQAQAVAKQMGMNLSTAVTVLLTKLVRERKLEVQAPLTENGFTEEYEKELLADIEKKDIAFVANTKEEAVGYLESLMNEK